MLSSSADPGAAVSSEQGAVSSKAEFRLAQRVRAATRFAPLLLLGAPTVYVIASDALRRGSRILHFDLWHGFTYGAAVLESLLVWGLLVAGSSGRGAGAWPCRMLFALCFVLACGGQAYFFQQYNTYLSVDVSVFAGSFVGSVIGQWLADLRNYLAVSWGTLVFVVAVLLAARRWLELSEPVVRRARTWGPVLLVAALFVPTQYRQAQASTPDALYLHAAGGFLRACAGLTAESARDRPMRRQPPALGTLDSRPPLRRNVLFLILESARADAVCVDYDRSCRETPATNALFPDRVPLRQLRALDSSTAISLAVLWTGLGPHESREVLHTWPVIFDYAHAAGWHSVFWTSQNLLFGNSRLWVADLPVNDTFSATDLDPESDLDLGAPEHLLAERVARELPRLPEPFLAVIQLSNGHAPYLVDPALPQPFQPASTSKAPRDARHHFNHYKNALHQQDLHLARMLAAWRKTPAGQRTVVVYTSDHGEAFREHSQSGHTFSVFDEEIRVPGWIDAPPGTLTDEEGRALAAQRDAFTFHPDLSATLLDLMGLWDEPRIARFKERMLGVSLLREKAKERPLPLTNCAGVWSCAYENWGYMRGSRKLLARAWDPAWQCFDVLDDPEERRDLGPAACGDLLGHVERTFGRLPGPKDGTDARR